GQRHRDRDLAIVLLAEHATVLTRHPDRVPPLLGNPGVVHDPGRHCAVTLHLLQYVVTRYPQDRLVIPRSIGNEVMQRLMAGPHVPRVDTGRHRLNALSLPRQTEAHQIRTQRLAPIRVPEHRSDALQVLAGFARSRTTSSRPSRKTTLMKFGSVCPHTWDRRTTIARFTSETGCATVL